MIPIHIKPSILKSLNFNEENKSLEIEFKKDVKTVKYIEIPIATIKEFINSLNANMLLENAQEYPSHLKIVHSNFNDSLN
jgi:hypothetical protein